MIAFSTKRLRLLFAIACTSLSDGFRKKRAGELGYLAMIGFLSLTVSNSNAADVKRGFLMGGGVGGLRCTDFMNAMATARLRGGLSSIEGIKFIDPYSHYVLGFQTGFNYEASGVYDIFEGFGVSPALNVLIAVEVRCAKNPTEKFSEALLVTTESLRQTALRNSKQ